jgi:hypothetical protein
MVTKVKLSNACSFIMENVTHVRVREVENGHYVVSMMFVSGSCSEFHSKTHNKEFEELLRVFELQVTDR